MSELLIVDSVSYHLPPLSVAPILEYYNPKTKRVDISHQHEAPVDDRGVVDIFKTVELALSLVDDEYMWPKDEPKADIHHFVWERDKYHPRHFSGSQIPRDYRDKISFHKGYLPRQLHNFLHVTIAPPEVPDFIVMENKIKDFEIALSLFESARGAVTALHRPRKIAGIPVCSDSGEILLDDEIMLQIACNFERYFENSIDSVSSANQFFDVKEIDRNSPETVAKILGRIAGVSAVNLMPYVYKRRKYPRTAA